MRAAWPTGPVAEHVPRFPLNAEQRQSLREFVANLPASPSPTAPSTRAADTFRRRNCQGCHARDGRGGEAARFPGGREARGTTPPWRGGKGPSRRRISPRSATSSVPITSWRASGARHRRRAPWLSVRMPAFAFEPGEAESIVAWLQDHDRAGASSTRRPPPIPLPTPRPWRRPSSLIGQRGFGCVSCHVLAGRIPPGGEPETLGPDLALAHRRMSERYFRRWVANPQRIIPGTPMPQFLKPIESAPGTLDDQFGAIWRLLDSPRLAEAAGSGTRELLKRQGDRGLVVLDMVVAPDLPGTPFTPRGLAIGLSNGQSLLFDADRLSWIAWWQGGFLARTKAGRLWEWHPDGERLWTAPARRPPIVFLGHDGSIVAPTEIRERFGSFSGVDFDGPDVSLSYRLNGPQGARVTVRERIRPLPEGWERSIHATDLPAGPFQPLVVEYPPPACGRDRRAADAPMGRLRLAGHPASRRLEGPSPRASRRSGRPPGPHDAGGWRGFHRARQALGRVQARRQTLIRPIPIVGSVGDAPLASLPEGAGIPFQLVEEPDDPAGIGLVARGAVFVEGVLDLGDGEERRDARSPQLAEHGAQLHRGPDAAEGTRRIADDRGGAEEIFLEEMVEQVRERRRDAVIVLARDDDEGVGRADRGRQAFEDLGGLARLVLLVHPVEQREPVLERVDEGHAMAAPPALIDDEPGRPDPLAVATDRTVEDDDVQWHGAKTPGPKFGRTSPSTSPRTSPPRGLSS